MNMSQITTDIDLYSSNIPIRPFYAVMFILGFAFLITAIRSRMEHIPGQRMNLIPPAMLVLTSAIGFIADGSPFEDVYRGSLEIRPEGSLLCFAITTAMFLWVILAFFKFLIKLSSETD